MSYFREKKNPLLFQEMQSLKKLYLKIQRLPGPLRTLHLCVLGGRIEMAPSERSRVNWLLLNIHP